MEYKENRMLNSECLFKAKIVYMILIKENVESLKALSLHYGIGEPHLKVGMPKRHSKKVGCYVSKTKTIHVMNQDYLDDPFVILHEFYHHLRTEGQEHRGTEKYANRFAKEFIESFRSLQEIGTAQKAFDEELSKEPTFLSQKQS